MLFRSEKGILVHVNTGMYDTMKQKIGLQQLRRLLKNITPHNDKLGFDWDKSKPGEFAYKADATSKHYNKSTYVQFLDNASKWHRSQGNDAYAEHLNKVKQTFDMSLN